MYISGNPRRGGWGGEGAKLLGKLGYPSDDESYDSHLALPTNLQARPAGYPDTSGYLGKVTECQQEA